MTEKKRRTRGKNIIFGATMVGLSTILILLALELLFRVFDIRGYHEQRTREWGHALCSGEERLPGVRIHFKPYSQFEFNYDSNPRGYFNENNGLVYKMNKHGFRGPDYEMSKPENTRRVIVLGDSFTFGEGVKLEDTFCLRLQKKLNERVEVLNFGISAWGTADEINYFEQMGVKFQPDLVIVVFVLNDADYAGGLDLWEDFRNQYEKRYLRKSYLASYVYARIASKIYGRKYIDSMVDNSLREREKWKTSLALLTKGKNIAHSRGARYAVAIFPYMYELNDRYPFSSLQQMVYDHCHENGIAVLDLFDAFAGHDYTELWVHPSDQHPNETGHEIAAAALAEFIAGENLLR